MHILALPVIFFVTLALFIFILKQVIKTKSASSATTVKKAEKVDLTRYSTTFFTLGLVLSLAFTLVAFEWKSYEEKMVVLEGQLISIDDPEDPFIFNPPPPPKPKLKPVIKTAIIKESKEPIVEQEDLDLDFEFEPDTPVEDYVVTDEVIEEPEEVTNTPFIAPEVTAVPKNGLKGFYHYIKKELKYPKKAKRSGVQGKVFVEFVINTDGGISDLKILKGISPECDAEALRVIKGSPKWEPARQRGRNVRQKMVMPIAFKLGN